MLERLKSLFGLTSNRPAEVPQTLWNQVEATLPFLAFLTAEEHARLRLLAANFLKEKQFHGAHDFEIDDPIMLSIALQACLPILNIGLQAYRDWVGIIVYPGDFVVPRSVVDDDGVVHEYHDEVLGEAWEDGPVLLSWHLPRSMPEGFNVVIHEFAHKLDMSNGGADGFPPLPASMSRHRWAEVFSEAYAKFCDQVDQDEDTVLDPYASEHPAEFFAVASEAFFESPLRLQNAYPEVYEQLRALYRVDTAVGALRAANDPAAC